MTENLKFSAQAFAKMAMHAMRHPHAVCNGFLLSPDKAVQDENVEVCPKSSSTEKLSESTLEVVDAIPVSHSSLNLSPNLEIAYNAIQKFAKEKNLVISGFYQSDRYNEPGSPDLFSRRVADKISESHSNSVLCFVNFEGHGDPKLDPYMLSDGKWRRENPESFSVAKGVDFISKNIIYSKNKIYKGIIDFDDHLNNISLDWTNRQIALEIDNLTVKDK